MSYNAVDATAGNALQGLYLTPEMWFTAAHMTPQILEASVEMMHKTQPLTADYESFAERVNGSYYIWDHLGAFDCSKTDIEGYLGFKDGDLRLGKLSMMAADISMTYRQIRRALLAATNLATTIMLRNVNAEDTASYPRVIPAALDDLRISSIEHVNINLFHRILTVEPWLSWMERFRAQKQRSDRTLAGEDAGEALAEGIHERTREILKKIENTRRGVPKIERAARKSLRKSAALFDRVLGVEARRDFLRSWQGKPLLVEGHQYNYFLSMRRNSLFRTTIDTDTRMSTVATMVYNKAGERLCELCHYFRDTPALDCVIATTLNVTNEETELDLLRAACVIDAPRSFYHDPVLPELKGLRDPVTAPTLIENVFSHVETLPHEQWELRDQLRLHALPLAYVAFKTINHLPKQYLPLMRLCGEFSIVDYMVGDQDAALYLKLAQRNLQRGEF
jgi:hypothetical protein